MRRSFRIYIGPEKKGDLSLQTNRLASEILAGIHGEKAKELLEAEIEKATRQTSNFFEKIHLHVQICSNEELLRQILEKAGGDYGSGTC